MLLALMWATPKHTWHAPKQLATYWRLAKAPKMSRNIRAGKLMRHPELISRVSAADAVLSVEIGLAEARPRMLQSALLRNFCGMSSMPILELGEAHHCKQKSPEAIIPTLSSLLDIFTKPYSPFPCRCPQC
jgi:hypothetical protein